MFLSSADFFFQNQLFRKLFQKYRQKIKIRLDVLSGLIWVQTVWKGLADEPSRQRVKIKLEENQMMLP